MDFPIGDAEKKKMMSDYQTYSEQRKRLGYPEDVKSSSSGIDRIKTATSRVVNNPYVSGAIGFVKERSQQIAHEMQESHAQERREHSRRGRAPARRRESYDPPMSMNLPQDPFGVGGLGWTGERESHDEPKRRRKRRRTYREPAPKGPQMFGIPKHLRHLF